ncbi:MAG: general secretion pathway protein GspK, partial [bacterium]|nr:general secretion pathway protein GspK [bacterium]
LADAGVHAAIMELLREPDQGQRPRDGGAFGIRIAGEIVTVSIQNEAGKIDINHASAELIAGLFVSTGLSIDEAEMLSDRIIDFRDRDDTPRRHGAEREAYAASGSPVRPSNAPFSTIEEMKHVLGMPSGLLEQIRSSVTTHAGRANINPVVASEAVLIALPGVEGDLAKTMTAGDVAPNIAGYEINSLLPAQARRHVGFGLSKVYSIRAEAKRQTGATFVRRAVVKLTGNRESPYEILEWGRGYGS